MLRFLRIMRDYAHILVDVYYAQSYALIMCASLTYVHTCILNLLPRVHSTNVV